MVLLPEGPHLPTVGDRLTELLELTPSPPSRHVSVMAAAAVVQCCRFLLFRHTHSLVPALPDFSCFLLPTQYLSESEMSQL